MQETEQRPIESYFTRISRYPLITTKREGELARKIRSGDEAALEELVNANLRLVVKISHDYKSRGVPLEDLISEGNMGLVKAARRFDPKKGAKFSTYAAWWVKHHMGRCISWQRDSVRIPPASMSRLIAVDNAKRKLEHDSGTAPTPQQVARMTGLTERTVRHYWASQAPVSVSLNHSQEDEQGATLALEDKIAADVATPGECVARSEDEQLLHKILGGLPDRDRTLLEERFGLRGEKAMTLDNMAAKHGVTRESIRLWLDRIITGMRAQMEAV